MTSKSFTSGTVIDSAWLNDVNGATYNGSGIYTPAGTGAVSTTVQSQLRLLGVFPENYGALGNGVADDTAALNAAMTASNGYVFLDDAKTYKITSQLVIPSTCKGIIGKGMYTSTISKSFNGDLIKCDTNGAIFQHFAIAGNGGTYTGGGIRPRGYNILIQHCRIADTQDCPIVVEDSSVSNTLAATYLNVDSCFLQGTSSATYAARLVVPNGTTQGTDGSLNPTGRVFSNISGGAPLVDFSGMNYATLDKSLGTLVKFNSTSAKIHMGGGNRITSSTASIVIYGQDHVIDGNFWGFGAGQSLTIDSTSSNITFGPNNPISIGSSFNQSVLQNQTVGLANANTVYSKLQQNMTLPWLGSTTNPTIGNGSFINYYEQDGRLCSWQLEIVTGSTTNVGSGNYSFQLPFKALVSAYGPCQVKSSSGTYYAAQFIVQGGASVGTISLIGITPALFASTSMALSAGSLIQAQVAYQIAAS